MGILFVKRYFHIEIFFFRMSGEFGGNDGFYSGGYNYDQNTNYEMGGAQFGQDT